jgi:hypothetical protein
MARSWLRRAPVVTVRWEVGEELDVLLADGVEETAHLLNRRWSDVGWLDPWW